MLTTDEAARLLQGATKAHERGDALLHLQAAVSRLPIQDSSGAPDERDTSSSEGIGDFLSEVERSGWRLEHTGYAFVESGGTASPGGSSSATGVVNHGEVIGYFTFRRA